MSCVKIRKKVFDDIERITTKFWWGSKAGMQQLCWESLSKLYNGYYYGGYGFKELNKFNLSLLTNLGGGISLTIWRHYGQDG